MAWRLAALLALVPLCGATPPTVQLRNGVKLPLLSAGVWQYNSSQAEASISAALSVGFTAMDTALDYHNQDGIGRAVKAAVARGVPRGQIFVETKVPGCLMDPTTKNPFACYDDTKKNLETDLQLLDLPFLDLVVIHFPPAQSLVLRSCGELSGSCAMIRSQWKAMVEFYKAGKARAIGVSNYCPSCFECLKDAEVQPMVNQVMYHVGMGADPGNIISYGKSRGIVTQAYSVLGHKPWTHSADPEILTGNLTTAIAKAHKVSTVQVALKFVVSHGVAAVTKSSNPKHLKSDLDLWSWDFTSEELEQLRAFQTPGIFEKYSFSCSSLAQPIVV